MAEVCTALYRLYDAAGRLLYIGATFYPRTRMSQHRRTKSWWFPRSARCPNCPDVRCVKAVTCGNVFPCLVCPSSA